MPKDMFREQRIDGLRGNGPEGSNYEHGLTPHRFSSKLKSRMSPVFLCRKAIELIVHPPVFGLHLAS